MKNIFDVLLLIARPAAGKSEVIDYLKNTSLPDRVRRFHVGQIDEIDDFPMLWTWFEEDALLEKMGHPRLYTDQDGYFLNIYLWDLLIERIGLEYQKRCKKIAGDVDEYTTLVEFSRGKQHGGYRRAFTHLDAQMLEKTAVLYIDVPWEESLRKNRKRYNPEKPDSILEHSLPDRKLEHLYKEIDWEEISSKNPQFLEIKGQQVPYVVFQNADDVTTERGNALGQRLEEKLNSLWTLYKS